MSALVFLDTETVGLHPLHDHIWEVAALRVDGEEPFEEMRFLVEHASPRGDYLESEFAADYRERWNQEQAISRAEAADRLREIFRGRAHMAGMVPSFDAERLGVMRRLAGIDEPDPWHYHLIDVEALAIGYLWAKRKFGSYRPGHIESLTTLPWDSDELSRAVGVEPEQFFRHQAMGDVRWSKAIYDAIAL